MDDTIVRYELSKDGLGLRAYFKNGQFYHIHKIEMTELEKWIQGLLKEVPHD